MSELNEKKKNFHFVSIPTTVAQRKARKTHNSTKRLPITLQSEAYEV